MKKCSKCGETKSELEFYFKCKKSDETRAECKKCTDRINKSWRKNNPNRIQKYRGYLYHKKRLKKIKDKYGLGAGTVARYSFRLALKIYEKFDRKCYECGEGNDLTIHHLDNNGRNNYEKGLKVNNNEDNLVLICRRCHGSIHGKQNPGRRR